MATFEWRPFLEQYSRELLADREMRQRVAESVARSGWMGFEPATEAQLAELEARLGVELPDSYRQFLAVTNGWRQSGGFIDALWPCAQVDWFRANHQDWIDAYVLPSQGEPPVSLEEHCDYGPEQDCCKFRVKYLQATLLISEVGDSAVYLLNPEIKTASGEWEAWFFANWLPGARRYHSFWDLMQAQRQSFVELRDHDELRYFPEDGLETLPPKLPGLIQELMAKAQEHRTGQQDRLARGRPQLEDYTDGVIAALEAALVAVRMIATQDLSPSALLDRLTDLAVDLERQWKADCRPLDTFQHDERGGQAEGSREATAIVRWFLNQPQS